MTRKLLHKLYRVKEYYSKYGAKRFTRHVFSKLFHLDEMNYGRLRKTKQLSSKEIERQRAEVFAQMPLISILVPLYCTPSEYLKALIESMQQQTYANWELCLSDGSGLGKMDCSYIEECMKRDERIKLAKSDKPLAIAENTNQALKLAKGDFIAFADHDDLLEINTLYECVKVINVRPETEIIYTDEDKVSMNGKSFFQPHFKSDFNLDLLRSMNYICHFFVVKRNVQEQVGELRQEYDGAQDYDFVLRCVEKTKHIYHIPEVLYHWRAHQDSTAENPESKRYAFEAGIRALESHLERCGIKGTVTMTEQYGLYRVKYELEKEPLVSILIPNKDHVDDLQRCVISLYENSDYPNFEIIIIENGSVEEATFQYYEEISMKYSNVQVVTWNNEGEFNFSALNNYGATFAEGEYLLFLNNDTEILEKSSIAEMVSHMNRPEVGAVGARLYYEDGTVQHAGVIVGLGGIAGHAFKDAPKSDGGYFFRSICVQDYSAVTAACMMMSKPLFGEIGGFDEGLKVAFNDIDLCMQIRSKNRLIVYTPYAELYHYESKSRGLENTKEKVKRFNGEVNYFAKKWKKELDAGDPYYNKNLTLEKHDFSLKIL